MILSQNNEIYWDKTGITNNKILNNEHNKWYRIGLLQLQNSAID